MKPPDHVSEFEIQAFIYSKLKELGVNVRGEVNVPFDNSKEPLGRRRNRRAKCRLDLAIFKNDSLAEIIEVKTDPEIRDGGARWRSTRQGRRYTSMGVPVAIIYGMEEAESFVAHYIM
jgi:hypothetical protein